jgi:uncharacterized protein (UPF0332 family)
MLDKKRIKEAEQNVKSYLNEKLLSKNSFESIVFDVLMNNSRESIETAKFLTENNKSNLWIIVTSYYSMFYIASAVLYKLGYKVGDKIPHKVVSDALIVFVKDKLKESLLENYEELRDEALLLAKNRAENLVETFDYERSKRGFIQYKTKEIVKTSKAETSLKRAEEFIFEMKKLILDLERK